MNLPRFLKTYRRIRRRMFWSTLAAMVLALPRTLRGQTQLSSDQIREDAATGAETMADIRLRVRYAPGSRQRNLAARVDGGTFSWDGNELVLTIPPPGGLTPVAPLTVLWPGITTTTWDIPHADAIPETLEIKRNGVEQYEHIDWARNGLQITFRPTSQPGQNEVMSMRYWRP